MTALIQERSTLQTTIDLQNAAANPERSIWLAASAGTGKTKVLVDRLLRLLLDGCPPESLLCLTFTKAAAAEMSNRLFKVLNKWVTMPRDALYKDFEGMGLMDAGEHHIDRARELFAVVLDCPGGLHIQTLHSFCQELLQRFPLEAELVPNFAVLDEAQTANLQSQAITRLLQQVSSGADADLANAFATIQAAVGEHSFRDLLGKDLAKWHCADTAELAVALDVDASVSSAAVLARACAETDGYRDGLVAAANTYINHGSAEKVGYGKTIAAFLSAESTMRPALWGRYSRVFLTNEGTVRGEKGLYPKALLAKHSGLGVIVRTEAERVLRAVESINAARIFELTRDFNTVATRYQALYRLAKNQQAAVDYNDLIIGAEGLLTKAAQAAWVRFKLDHQLRHVLVDEAQDTSPAQWAILRALVDEFGASAPDERAPRTVFVVGDEKQSIYSFQGAAPHFFAAEREYYKKVFGGYFDALSLTLSFRSAQAVLDVVNQTFAGGKLNQVASRTDAAGVVELWPLVGKAPPAAEVPWQLPLTSTATSTPRQQVASRIAATVRAWLDAKECLPDRQQPITPGDIMILVQKRSTYMESIVKALKNHDVPVAGVDKLVLGEQLVVQDLFSLINFVLLPADDLNLAALLKTPLCGVDEDTLFALCHGRTGSLWQRVQQQLPAVADYLRRFLAGRAQRPYDFLQRALRDACAAGYGTGLEAFRSRLGDEVLDPLHELLQTAIAFETGNTATLQSFMQTMALREISKKRELSEAAGKVRVMTVHAAKGLQAPIVFLADAADVPSESIKSPMLDDPANTTAPMFYVPFKDMDAAITQARRMAHARIRREEYQRLLYVAMTRAEDKLIIAGIANKADGTAPDDSWYGMVARAFAALPCVQVADRLVYANGRQTHKGTADDAEATQKQHLPAWATVPVVPEAALQRPLAPSRLVQPDVAYASPLAADDRRFTAGIVTHRLLELLPGKNSDTQAEITRRVLSSYASDLPAERLQQIKQEVDAILGNAAFAPLFGPGSRAEVPLVGMVEGEAIVGQVDRLLVTDSEVLVVDYKTNRPPPKTVDDVAEAYIKQLRCYARLLQEIHPGRIVKAALLWTDGPVFMPIPASRLGN